MKFTIAEDLGTYSAEELAAKIKEGQDLLAALFSAESPTPADVAEAKDISAKVESLQGESTARATAADDMKTLAAQAGKKVEASDEGGETEQAKAEREAAEAKAKEDEAAAAAKAEEEAAAEKEKEAVTASARERLAGTKPPAGTTKPAATKITITAAADVPSFATGSKLEGLDDVVEALTARMGAFPAPAGIEGGQMHRYGAAMFRREYGEEFTTNGNNDQDVLDLAGKEARLPGGNLIAAGGWCAPSETLYDLCEGETTDGLLDLPEINVKRGGIRTTTGPDFSTIYAAGFTQTEAQAIAGTVKTCYTVPCPTFTDTRLDAMGICIKSPILQNVGYPELLRRVVSGGLIAHQHRVSAGLIQKMVTAAGTAVLAGNVQSTTSNLGNSLAIIAEGIRESYRLGVNETLEVVLPIWVKEAIRADLAQRNGVDLKAVTDAEIMTIFTVRKVRPQFVYNWQMLVEPATTPPGTYRIGFPTTVQMLVYPAGTFVRGGTDVINLDAVYDAASLSTNDYTALFFEEGVLLAQRCYKARLITANIVSGGFTGGQTAAPAGVAAELAAQLVP